MNRNQTETKISKEEVKHVADLARLDMDEDSIGTFAEQIGNILGHIDALSRVDTEGVPPMSHALDLNNAFREDEVRGHLDLEAALYNAPEREGRDFTVPKVIG